LFTYIDPEVFLLTVGQVLPQPIKADLTARVKKNNEARHVFRILADYLAAAFYQQELPTEDPSPRPEDHSDEPPEEEAGETNQSEFDKIQRRVRKQVLQILAAGE